MPDTAGPAWDLSTEYAAPDDSAIDADLAELEALLAEAERQSEPARRSCGAILRA